MEFPELLGGKVLGFDNKLKKMPIALFDPIPLGFPKIDAAFGGGANPQHVMLIGGRQNVGKTILVVQIARNIATWAAEHDYPIVPAVFCYEHDELHLYIRLLCMESYHVDPENPIRYHEVVQAIKHVKQDYPNEENVFSKCFEYLPDVGVKAHRRISKLLDRIILYGASRVFTSYETIVEIMDFYQEKRGLTLIPIIDYWQTMPPVSKLIGKEIENPNVVRSFNLGLLKDLAKSRYIPVIAVAAMDKNALVRPGPVHFEDVLGPEVAQYTPDDALILNPESIHEYMDEKTGKMVRRTKIRMSIEKSRGGPSELEWSHEILGGSFFISEMGEEVKTEDSYQMSRRKLIESKLDK